jgi:hypothetical protein
MIPIFRAATEGSGTGTTDLVLILPRWLRAGPTLYSPVLAEAPRPDHRENRAAQALMPPFLRTTGPAAPNPACTPPRTEGGETTCSRSVNADSTHDAEHQEENMMPSIKKRRSAYFGTL